MAERVGFPACQRLTAQPMAGREPTRPLCGAAVFLDPVPKHSLNRKGWDSNPRALKEGAVFETAPLDHSGTLPCFPLTLTLSRGGERKEARRTARSLYPEPWKNSSGEFRTGHAAAVDFDETRYHIPCVARTQIPEKPQNIFSSNRRGKLSPRSRRPLWRALEHRRQLSPVGESPNPGW